MLKHLDEKSELLTALAHPARYHIVMLLLSSEMSTGDIASSCGLSREAASHALCYLCDRGYILRRVQGTYRFYRCEHEGMRTLMPLLNRIAGSLREPSSRKGISRKKRRP